MNINQLERIGTDPNEFGSEVIIYKNEYDEIIENCKNSADFVLELLRNEISKDEKLKEYSNKFDFSKMFNNSTVEVSAHITIDIIDFKEDVLPPLTLNYFGTLFMQSFNEKHMNELSEKVGRRFTLRMHRNMFKDNITIALVSYNPYLVRQGATKDNSFNAYEYLKKTRGEESLKYEDFNDIGNEGFISDAFKKLFGKNKKKKDLDADKIKISNQELIKIHQSIAKDLKKDAQDILKKVSNNHKEFFKNSPKFITFSPNFDADINEHPYGIGLYYYDLNEVVTPDGDGYARSLFQGGYGKLSEEALEIEEELLNESKYLVEKYFKENLLKKGVKVEITFLGDWDDGDIGIWYENIKVFDETESTEALKDIVKKVAKKAADKAGIIPAGTIDVNKKNIKGFAKACDVLQNYGQSRELINRSFKGININTFGSKSNLDAFMNSIKPVGKFRVAQGWLVFDLFETDTYKLKNDLDKESWDAIYDASGMITKKANYVTIKIIKELFGSRDIELHPNPIGHLLSKGSTKASIMFKLGKLNNVEDGTYSARELVDKIRTGIGVESFEFSANVFDMTELEYGIEEVINDYNFFETIGIESDMISISEVFGEIEDLNEMIAIESFYGFESSIARSDYTEDIINEIHNRMEQDPILKLAKDKELIEVKANPNAKKRISINFKEIKDIEKVLTPEDIQKYGGSTYQFLLKLSDTFNKNIMWKMKDIEEVARSGESDDSLDAEAIESLTGREYYLAVGIETVNDILNEILVEDGTEGLDEFKESARAWVKKIVAKIIDFLGKERWIFRAQVRTYNKIKAKIDSIGKNNYQDYDLGNIKGAISTLAFINKKKYLFYRGLNNINFENIESVKGSMKYLDSAKEDLKNAISKLQEVAAKIKSGNYSYRDPQMGDLNTIKSTMSKVKLEWVDVKQNFLKLEKMINDENIEDETIKNGLKGFLTVSSALQREYLKGVNEALNICSELLKESKLKEANESVDIDIVWNWRDIESKGIPSSLRIKSKNNYNIGEEGFFSNLFKKKEKENIQPKKKEEDIYEKLLKEYESKMIQALKPIGSKIAKNVTKTKEFKDMLESAKKDYIEDYSLDDWNEYKDEYYFFECNPENYGFAISALDFSQDVTFSNSDKLFDWIINEFNKHMDKYPKLPNGYSWVFNAPFDDESCIWVSIVDSGSAGTEGFFDTIRQKWKDGIEKQKSRREKERKEREEAYRNKQKASNSSKVIKTLSSTAELNKLQSNCVKVVKSIYDEVKSNVSKAKLDFIELSPFDKNDAVDILNEYGDYQLEFHFLYYATPKWAKDNHDEVFEQEEKLWDIIESAINKHKDKFGVSIEYYGVDGNLSWGLTNGYIRVSENAGAESEIVQAIYDEFGTEGITSIIKRITSSK